MNNTLKYVKILEGAGITREQAEAHVQLITDITEGDLATKENLENLGTTLKQDLENLGTAFKKDLENLGSAFKQDVRNLETKLDTSVERWEHKMLQMEYRLTIKLGTIVTVVIAAATAVIKLV